MIGVLSNLSVALDPWQMTALVLLGLVAGLCGGLLGIGGSVVMIPGLVLLLGTERQHLYQAAALMVNVFVVVPAVIRHRRAHATIRDVLRWMVPCAVIGAIAGVYLSELSLFRGEGRGFLQIGFALCLTYVVIHNVLCLLDNHPEVAVHERVRALADGSVGAAARMVLVGLPTGLLAGLLGIGGGLVAVPAQQFLLRLPLRNAIANSAATILFSSAIGGLLKNAHLGEHGFFWGQAVVLVVFLSPTAVVGSWLAAAKVHHWPTRALRAVFVVLLSYCAVMLFIKGWNQARTKVEQRREAAAGAFMCLTGE